MALMLFSVSVCVFVFVHGCCCPVISKPHPRYRFNCFFIAALSAHFCFNLLAPVGRIQIADFPSEKVAIYYRNVSAWIS